MYFLGHIFYVDIASSAELCPGCFPPFVATQPVIRLKQEESFDNAQKELFDNMRSSNTRSSNTRSSNTRSSNTRSSNTRSSNTRSNNTSDNQDSEDDGLEQNESEFYGTPLDEYTGTQTLRLIKHNRHTRMMLE